MSQHTLAFTLLTSQSDESTVVLSTQKEYRDQAGTVWVETADGKVRKDELLRATRPLNKRALNQYGESLTGDTGIDAELLELAEERRRAKLASNKAAIANKATIHLPVEDARDFRVGVWYVLRFDELDKGESLRSLIGNVVHTEESVAVEREQKRERSTDL